MDSRQLSLNKKKMSRNRTENSLPKTARSSSRGGPDFSKARGRGENIYKDWEKSLVLPEKLNLKNKNKLFFINNTPQINIMNDNDRNFSPIKIDKKIHDFRKRDFNTSQLINVPGNCPTYEKFEKIQNKGNEKKKMHSLVLKQMESYYLKSEAEKINSINKNLDNYKKEVILLKNTGKKCNFPMKNFLYHNNDNFLTCGKQLK